MKHSKNYIYREGTCLEIYDLNNGDDDFFVDVSADCSVTRFFYKFIIGQVSDAVPSMTPGMNYNLPLLLDLFLWDFLSTEGRRAAQQCVEHVIREEGLPLVCSRNGVLTRI
jgi:hypothetical protein